MMFLFAWLTTQYQLAVSKLQARTSPRLARARGVSMLEYVLIAAVVLFVAGIFAFVFKDAMGDLINRIGKAIKGSDAGS